MDVTQQVNRQMIGSGAGSSRPESFAVNRSLNYAQGSNNITTARSDLMTTAPAVRNYKDSVGLFGAENIFIRYDLDITNSLLVDGNGIILNDYTELELKPDGPTNIYWDEADTDYSKDQTTVNTYDLLCLTILFRLSLTQ